MSIVARPPEGPENRAQLEALERMLRRADGFRLAFAVANHGELRRRLAEQVRRDLPDRRIADVRLEPGQTGGAVEAIRSAADGEADAIFVHGLDELDPLKGRAHATTGLNLGRDLLWRTVRVPVVFWVPDFAAVAFARAAPDLWSGRSGLYRFVPEAGDAEASARTAATRLSWSVAPSVRSTERSSFWTICSVSSTSDRTTFPRAR